MFRTYVLAAVVALVALAACSRRPSPQLTSSQAETARAAQEEYYRGRYQIAEKHGRHLAAETPTNVQTLHNLGVMQFRAGKLKEAEITLRQATFIDPHDASVHSALGLVYYSLARYNDAVTSLLRAIELDPKNAVAHNYLSITYSQKGMSKEAASELAIVTELDPIYFSRN